jgi:hypothetical protein
MEVKGIESVRRDQKVSMNDLNTYKNSFSMT